MNFRALATDYDGTIARHGGVEASTVDALLRWKESGRKLLLVTGREMPDLRHVFPHWNIFDCIVAENGALLCRPGTNEQSALAGPPPAEFIRRLRDRGVTPLSAGEVIVATVENYRGVVLEVIEEMELKWKVILNKGAVMVLPVSVDKATGLRAALAPLNLTPADVAGVGDAENDQVFLGICGYSVAVANALGFLKKQVHYVTHATHGAGVEELIGKLLAGDHLPAPMRQREFSEG